MLDSGTINRISDRISQLLPPELQQVKADIDQKVRAVVQNQLAQLDFVSREEFDIQRRVLERTRAKLDALEKKLDEIEQQLASP